MDTNHEFPRAINDLQRHNADLQRELTAVFERVAAKGWYVLGKEVEAFEQEFAQYCGVDHAIGVANGTEALELVLRAVGVNCGDSVAIVANAGGYGTIALNSMGAIPIYVDVDANTHTMDPLSLEQAIRSAPIKAVIVTHLYGRLAHIEAIRALANKEGIRLVEDCAQAHGARRGGTLAGAFGDAGCFSFYPTKNLGALGDGGAVITHNHEIACAVRELRQYGWSNKYQCTRRFGRNSRLDEVQAAILRVKLPHLDRWNARRAEIARRYSERINHPRVSPALAGDADYVAHLYVLRALDRGSLSSFLRSRSVPHDIHYPIPDHWQPMNGKPSERVGLPITEILSKEVLTLPCFPEMMDAEVDAIADAVNSWSH